MSTPSRRAFVGALAGACALPGCASVATYRVAGPLASGRVVVPRAEFDLLAAERGAIRVESASLPEPVVLFADPAGGFRAIGTTCTHQQCAVRPGGGFLRCACHGSTFDLDGKVVRGPAAQPLARYDVIADGDTIRIAAAPVETQEAAPR